MLLNLCLSPVGASSSGPGFLSRPSSCSPLSPVLGTHRGTWDFKTSPHPQFFDTSNPERWSPTPYPGMWMNTDRQGTAEVKPLDFCPRRLLPPASKEQPRGCVTCKGSHPGLSALPIREVRAPLRFFIIVVVCLTQASLELEILQPQHQVLRFQVCLSDYARPATELVF